MIMKNRYVLALPKGIWLVQKEVTPTIHTQETINEDGFFKMKRSIKK